MKKALRVSILLNLVLAGWLMVLLETRNAYVVQPASDASPTNPSADAESTSGEGITPAWKERVSTTEQPAPAEFSQTTAIPSSSGRNRLREPPVVMPLVFQDADLSRLRLNDDQLQAIDYLRQKFLDELGGPQQDLADPAYRERWIKSQPEIDSDLKGMI